MPALSEARIRELILPYLKTERTSGADLVVNTDLVLLATQLAAYLELLLRWNARMNLTAVRDPELIVQRHFGESLFAACCLHDRIEQTAELLDLGSGAGFPGIPIQLLWPTVKVTLAESQRKKVAFLREAVRVLGVSSEVWAGRAEDMLPSRTFDVVTLRAVDQMAAMTTLGRSRTKPGGWLLQMSTRSETSAEAYPIPGSRDRVVALTRS